VFTTLATESGTLTLTWTGDHGFEQTETVALTVT
jgi:sulfur-oxidizing protein SoxZ